MIKFAPIAETEVVSLVSEDEGVVAKLRSTAEPPLKCPYCGAERVRNGTRMMIFRDIPQNEQPTRIEWRRQKFVCPRCSRSSHDNHPAFDERHAVTKRFVEWVAGEGRKVTFLSLSKQSGVNEKVIRQIFAKAEKATDRPRAEMLGIELIKVASSLYPALVNIIPSGAIIDVFSSAGAFLNRLALDSLGEDPIPLADIVVCDFDLLDELKGWFSVEVKHVISRSSLHRVALTMFEEQVQGFFKQLPKSGKQSTAPDLALFRKRSRDLGQSSRTRLSRWERDNPPLYEAYALKEQFMNIWSFDRNPSKNQWDTWQKQVSMLGLDFEVLTRRMDSNQKAIAEYIEYRALHDRYPGILTKAQRIDKAATHSFSASRAILLASQNQKR